MKSRGMTIQTMLKRGGACRSMAKRLLAKQHVASDPTLASLLKKGGSLKSLAETLIARHDIKDPRKARITVKLEN